MGEMEVQNTISRVSTANVVHVHLKTYIILLVRHLYPMLDTFCGCTDCI